MNCTFLRGGEGVSALFFRVVQTPHFRKNKFSEKSKIKKNGKNKIFEKEKILRVRICARICINLLYSVIFIYRYILYARNKYIIIYNRYLIYI